MENLKEKKQKETNFIVILCIFVDDSLVCITCNFLLKYRYDLWYVAIWPRYAPVHQMFASPKRFHPGKIEYNDNIPPNELDDRNDPESFFRRIVNSWFY